MGEIWSCGRDWPQGTIPAETLRRCANREFWNSLTPPQQLIHRLERVGLCVASVALRTGLSCQEVLRELDEIERKRKAFGHYEELLRVAYSLAK
jgi:hypothetical protein